MTQERSWRAVLAITGAPGLHEAAGSAAVVDVSTPHSLAVTLEDGASPVLVATHRIDLAATRAACSLLVGHRPDVPVAVVTAQHAPLAMLGALVRARSTAADAGHGADIWRALLAGGWSGAVLDSVATLERPNPTMAQHVRSWLPGSRFVVRQEPQPRSVEAKHVSQLFTELIRGDHDLSVTPAGTDDPVIGSVVAAAAPQDVQTQHVPGQWSRLYGRVERFQFALLPAVSTWAAPRPQPPCPVCGLSRRGVACLFCRRVLVTDEAEPTPAGPTVNPTVDSYVPAHMGSDAAHHMSPVDRGVLA